MTIYYWRSGQNVRKHGEEKAKSSPGTSTCPSCGKPSDLIEKYDDRDVYKCTGCGATNTFTVSPAKMKKVKKSKEGPNYIVVRDKSKEKKQKESVTVVEEIEEPDVMETVSTLRESMLEKKVIEFDYVAVSGKESSRKVEPYKLSRDRHGNVILYAYCVKGKGIRRFNLRGMTFLNISDEEYVPRWKMEDELDE